MLLRIMGKTMKNVQPGRSFLWGRD